MFRLILTALLLAAAFVIAGSQRTGVAQWDGGVVAMQVFLVALLLFLPCCLLATRWSRRLTLWVLVTLFGVVGTNGHAALNEAAVQRRHGAAPRQAVVEQRWFPFSKETIRFEPAMRKWMGDD